MARPSSSARRYAEAAFEIAQAQGNAAIWLAQLERAAAAAADERSARQLANPQLPFEVRLRAIVEVGGASGRKALPQVANLLALLLRRRRLDVLPATAREFRRLQNRSQGIVEASVVSAAPLEAREMRQIRGRLEAIAGARVEVETSVDPSLLGGIQVRLGDRLLDGSVRGRLERLRAALEARA
jgi:F-type H+-transporting ATPase subunit delta